MPKWIYLNNNTTFTYNFLLLFIYSFSWCDVSLSSQIKIGEKKIVHLTSLNHGGIVAFIRNICWHNSCNLFWILVEIKKHGRYCTFNICRCNVCWKMAKGITRSNILKGKIKNESLVFYFTIQNVASGYIPCH